MNLKNPKDGTAKPEKSNSGWAWVGKISAVVLLLIGLFQLKEFVSPSGPKIQAKVRQSDFIISPDLQDALDAWKSFPDEDKLFEVLTNSVSYFSTNIDYANQSAARLSNMFRHEIAKGMPIYGPHWRHYSDVTIVNRGDKQAEQLVLKFKAFAPSIAVITRDGTNQVENVLGSVELGSLRPSENVDIQIWSLYELFDAREGVVSYSTGMAKLQQSSELFGAGAGLGSFLNWILDSPFLSIWFMVIAVFIAWPIGSLLLRGYRSWDRGPDPERPEIICEAKDAKIHGKKIRFEESKEWETIGYWDLKDDFVTWEIYVSRPMKYSLVIEQACLKGSGGKYEVSIGSEVVSGKVEETGGWKEFVRCGIGEISIRDVGEYTLTVRPILIHGEALMNLRSIFLHPMESESALERGSFSQT